ncbi:MULTISPECIES: TIGR02647 family protein [Marinobacter]|uniref:TIGR02647 family protein n=1 Tax=Marinobacter profundi TaxID=2666256 RepID=A0A2G1UNL9_9GAMM|nr:MULTISPECIES: TIGR02647 family protein [Marinobacter]MBD3655099.1 TIGR02647 family protein [Marinobacter sp.]PHQ16010.1 TIGR02647 family protein [Marinobacter profundi]
MPFSPEQIAELNLLSLFDTTSHQEGLKVHQHSAPPDTVDAARRLHDKGLITQVDGGYLTNLGSEAVELTQKLKSILTAP